MYRSFRSYFADIEMYDPLLAITLDYSITADDERQLFICFLFTEELPRQLTLSEATRFVANLTDDDDDE